MIVFSWKLLLDRLPSRDNLFKRKVVVDLNLTSFPLCDNSMKLTSHLFVTCKVAILVCYSIFSWFGWQTILPKDLNLLCKIFYSLGGMVKSREIFFMIWHVVVWKIWKARNEIMFYDSITTAKDVEERHIFLD